MPGNREPLCILLVDDDADDRMLTQRALESSGLLHRLVMLEDGEELFEYLRREGKYGDSAASPRPDLILLDLNMPRKDGREVLEEIKSDPSLRRIPVVVLTTSEADRDVEASYDLGVNAFVTKPVAFESLASAMKRLGAFWLEVAELPKRESPSRGEVDSDFESAK
jgi:CheY-like chemotaxis protein